MWFSSLVSELRRHPVVYGACCAMTASACAVLLWHTARSWVEGGRGLPGWSMWVAMALIVVPQLWMARTLRRGPFSRDVKERAQFWKTARLMLMMSGLGFVFWTALLAGTAGYVAWRDRIPIRLKEGDVGRLALVGAYVLLGAGTFLVGWKLRGRVRRLESKCARCAYPLKGLDEPRCPECGTPFDPADYPGLSEVQAPE